MVHVRGSSIVPDTLNRKLEVMLANTMVQRCLAGPLLSSLLLATSPAIAQARSPQPLPAYSDLELTGVPVTDLVRVYFNQYRPGPYVVCPSVLADRRVVSVRATASNASSAVVALITSLGYTVSEKGGVVHVCSGSDSASSQSGLAQSAGENPVMAVPPGGSGFPATAPLPAVPVTRDQRLKDVGATGYLPRIVNRNGSTRTIVWPSETSNDCPTYVDTSRRDPCNRNR